jgi:hypothetical protein
MNDPTAPGWLLLLTSLSGRSASTPRVRLWRALRDLGVVSLRDGVALLPANDAHRAALAALGAQVEADGGTWWLLDLPTQTPSTEASLRGAFDRSEVYRGFRARLAELRAELPQLDEAGARRRLRQAQRELDAVAHSDFFPGDAQTLARRDLDKLSAEINRRFSPQEPAPVPRATSARWTRGAYQGRLWATRRRLWVDRVASAWLIRRFIDREARFLWLERPEDCPPRPWASTSTGRPSPTSASG